MTSTLYRKYRPQSFDQVVGQGPAVKALSRAIAKDQAQSFILAGPSGVGKTTMARIGAYAFGATPEDIIEVDGATYTGIDKMREIQEATRYVPFGNSAARAIIVDEAHRLSGNAWDALLKSVEEPPAHVAWFFCTTNIAKIPKTIQTRCVSLELPPVSRADIGDLVESIAKAEGMQLAAGVLDAIVLEAHGSPRQALVNLTTVAEAKSKGEALKLMHKASEGDASLELCRLVTNGGTWEKAMDLLDKLEEENPESIRLNVLHYLVKVVRSAKTQDKAGIALEKLSAFSLPYNQSEGHAPLLLSLAAVLLA